jgi:hypothetical protein
MALDFCPGQADRVNAAAESILGGCPGQSFKASPPFDEMRQDFAAFCKRPPRPYTSGFKKLKFYEKGKRGQKNGY